ncbi:MAG: hypothetical protein IJ721_08245 [Bacteroidales bacterium]|nr:hypothetical protein [Bacteroidales bacterium]
MKILGISSRPLRPTGSGDSLMQAYNFRISLTDSQENRIPIGKPDGQVLADAVLLVAGAKLEKFRAHLIGFCELVFCILSEFEYFYYLCISHLGKL